MNCRACDSTNRPGARYCQRCSAPLAASCYGCGSSVQRDGQLCAACRTERVPEIGADEIFPDRDDAEVTAIMTMPYELRPTFTGRSPALDDLMEAFEDSRDSASLSFALLVGEPGMGKTRIVKELARRLRRDAPETRFLKGVAETGAAAYSAFTQVMQGRFGIVGGDRAATSREKIIAGLAEVLPAARVTEVAHLVAHLMRVPFDDSPIVGPLIKTPQQLEMRTFIAVRRFLAADADAGPLVLCLENLDACGPETINLLHYLSAGLASSAVMILGTARNSLFERHPSFGDGDVELTRVDIGPLSESESKKLLHELCRPLDSVPDRLVNHAPTLGGSPRALFELIRLLLESNVIVRSGGLSWKVDDQALAEIELPTSYNEVVAARLAVMDETERDLIEKASVVGATFWLDAVVALVRVSSLEDGDPDGPTLAEIAQAGDHTRVSVAQALSKLVEREWIVEVTESSVPGEREYRFAYRNLWKLVYGGIDETARRQDHEIVARWLELRPEGREPLAQEDVAKHLERAGQTAAAAARYRRSAQAARSKFLNDKAIGLYARALACLGTNDLASRIHLWHDLGSVYELKGDFEAALGAFERMLRLAWVAASRNKAAVAFNKMGRVWRLKGDMKLALEYLERGAELFEQCGDARGIAASHDDIGRAYYMMGRYDEAFEHVTKGLADRGRRGDKRSIATSLSSLGNIQQDRGRLNEAHNCHQEALELRQQSGDRAGAIASHNNLAVLAYTRGDLVAARAGWQQALSDAEAIGALPLQALALSNLGELALDQSHTDEARRRLEDALNIAEEIADAQLVVETTRNLALLEKDDGNTENARELAMRSHRVAANGGLRDLEGRALLTLGEVWSSSLFDADETLASSPDDADKEPRAEEFFRRGLEVLREIGNDAELAKGLEQFGRYKIEHGNAARGKDLLREALSIFSRLGMPRSQDVQAVLAAI